MYKSAIEIIEMNLGKESTNLIILYSALGNVYEIQENLKEAEIVYKKAELLAKKIYGQEYRDTIELRMKLAKMQKKIHEVKKLK